MLGGTCSPSDSLQDWVTYADYLVEWQGTREGRIPPTPEESAAGEGTVTRVVSAESRQVLWRRPSAPHRLAAPQALDVADGGWEFHGKNERPFEGVAPRLEVGRSYLAVLSFTDLSAMSTRPNGPEWIALDYFALDDDQVVTRGLSPADRSVQHEALRLARLSYEAAIKGIAVQAILGIGALVLAVLALLTSPWWWGDAAVAASLAVLSAYDLRLSRARTVLLATASPR